MINREDVVPRCKHALTRVVDVFWVIVWAFGPSKKDLSNPITYPQRARIYTGHTRQ